MRLTRSTQTETLFPYTKLLRSIRGRLGGKCRDAACARQSIGRKSRNHLRWRQLQDVRRSHYHGVAESQRAGCIHVRNLETHGFRPVFSEFQHGRRSEEHTSELQSLMRISYAVFCLKKKTNKHTKKAKATK